jgi:PTH1 family peptidyl-tRNA hydrolase
VKLLVGLGNPGEEHRATRHNVGYLVVEELSRRHGGPPEERRARSLVCRARIGPEDLILARPLTYMNRSGGAVEALLSWSGAGAGVLLVICDDLYLDLGTVRLRPRGSHGGHNGLRSIIETLGTREFARLRVGVGPAEPGTAYADFVLAPFPRADRDRLEEVVGLAADCAEAAVVEGVPKAMNRFNRRAADAAGHVGTV